MVTRDDETLSLEELVAFLRPKGIATQKLPERLEKMDKLSYTPSGKLKKYLLREQIARIIRAEEGASDLRADGREPTPLRSAHAMATRTEALC